MRSRPDSRDPWWAPGTGAGFRQRCASALTHPTTVVALATLLLNDLLFKAMWPDAWVTGKLSDLAWVALALPLLAFLLSLLTRGSVIAARAAFLTAYVGLPLLYAAFNTFEPVHYWILRGISIASGGMGQTPLDATDSIVIPLGWAVAVWVWRRPVLSPDALRLRWGLLVAGVAALASIATSYPDPDYGITRVGMHTTEGGSVVVASNSFGPLYWSDDGGVTWTGAEELTERSVVSGSDSAETPKGRYAIAGTDILLFDDEGQSETVYSTAYLHEEGNVWAQDRLTRHLRIRRLTTQPGLLVYDERSGNLVVAMGIQGILVGTPDGRWTRHTVGPYTPTDFSFSVKTRLLLTSASLWAASIALSLSMTGAGMICAQAPRSNTATTLLAMLVALSVFTSSTLIVLIMGTEDPEGVGFGLYPSVLVIVAVPALLLGGVSILIALEQSRRWPAILGSFASMNVLVFLAFMLWLHLGITLGFAQISSIALTGLVAFLLAGYVRWTTP